MIKVLKPSSGKADQAPEEECDRLWWPDDVARFLGLKRKGVYGMAERGVLPSTKVGGRLRFDPVAIRKWVRSNHRGPVDDTMIDSQARVPLKRGGSL